MGLRYKASGFYVTTAIRLSYVRAHSAQMNAFKVDNGNEVTVVRSLLQFDLFSYFIRTIGQQRKQL